LKITSLRHSGGSKRGMTREAYNTFVQSFHLLISVRRKRPLRRHQAMNKNMRTILNPIIVLILLSFAALPAHAGQLKYIRVGEYESMTRIVFEFDSTVKFNGPEIKSPGQISVDFLDTKTDNPALQKMRDRAGRIEKIEFVQKKSVLSANISLTVTTFNIKPFYLFTPDRLVLDIYWTSAPAASASTVPPAPEKTTEAVSAKPATENITQTSAGPAGGTPVETGEKILQTASDSSRLKSYLSMGLIGFSIIALTIILFYTFSYFSKRRSVGSLESEVLPERPAKKRDDKLDEEIITSLDSKIQDELNRYGR
jgi:hypothetical protein